MILSCETGSMGQPGLHFEKHPLQHVHRVKNTSNEKLNSYGSKLNFLSYFPYPSLLNLYEHAKNVDFFSLWKMGLYIH